MILYKKQIDNLLLDSNKWAYYRGILCNYSDIDDILNESIYFVKDYLNRGNKITDEVNDNFDTVFDEDRLYHTISIFLFGLLIYDNNKELRSSINSYISYKNDRIREKDRSEDIIHLDEFSYYWFLICFFHDFSYKFVQKNLNENISTNNSINIFNEKSELAIDAKVRTNLDKIKKQVVDNAKNGGRYIVPKILIDNWEEYYNYRRYRFYVEAKNDLEKKFEKIDHGFFGGAYFYYIRNQEFNRSKRRVKREQVNRGQEIHRKDTFEYNGLMWSKHLVEEVHSDIGCLIASHNIWFNNKNSCSCSSNNIEDLTIEEPIFKIKEYPFYFILQLVDTLDLVKSYNNYLKYTDTKKLDIKEIFSKILYGTEIYFDENTIEIRFKEDMNINDKNFCAYMYKKLEEQEYWLPINVNLKNDVLSIKYIF